MIGKARGKTGNRPVYVYSPTERKKVYVGSRKTLKDAQLLEARSKIEFAENAASPNKVPTCLAYSERWFAKHHGAGTRRPEYTTLVQNKAMLKRFLDDFGTRPLNDIGVLEAHDWAQQHRYSAKVVRAMYNNAVREYDGLTNPFSRPGLEEKRGRKDIHPITEEEVQALADIAREKHGAYGPMCAGWITFAAWVGCRPGEMFALTWDDIDLKGGMVRIERQIRVDGIQATKTKKSRDVILPEPAADALRAMNTIRTGLVFTSTTGKPMQKGSYRYAWDTVRTVFADRLTKQRRAELLHGRPDLDLYELRHFCGSMLADRGLSARDISLQLGNSPQVCEETYIHTYRDRAHDRLREAFAATPTPLAAEKRDHVGEQTKADAR